MRVQTSKALLASPHEDGWIVYNFLKKTAAVCSEEAMAWLRKFSSWTVVEESKPIVTNESGEQLALFEMLQNDLLIIEGSEYSATIWMRAGRQSG